MIAARRPLPVLADIIIRRDFTALMFCPQPSNLNELKAARTQERKSG